ncbi:MAG: hypothetical protein R3293_19935 [Candidatus Promineifilaceae bacterium]|nr:hypothetical protein [Candidatus Promineifilaceae bacterium]
MSKKNETFGRVALTTGQLLAGFGVELRVGDFRVSAVTDGSGQFHLPIPAEVRHSAAKSRAEIIIRTPNNQIVQRQWAAVDGRYLGIAIPRKSLPAGVGGSHRVPRASRMKLDKPKDVGRQGDIKLPNVPRSEAAVGGRVVVLKNQFAAVFGSTLTIWPVTANGRASKPVLQRFKGQILDLAADPVRGELILLMGRKYDDASRVLLAVDAGGDVTERAVLDGPWDRLALLPGEPVLALAATSADEPAWAMMVKGQLRAHRLASAPQDIAFAGTKPLLAGHSELTTFDVYGKALDHLPWPAQSKVLVGTPLDAAFVYHPSRGRATRIHVNREGKLMSDDTIRLERRVPTGWWHGERSLIALLRDRLRWWRLPDPEPADPPAPADDEFIFYGRT